jgi:hypothetical protein
MPAIGNPNTRAVPRNPFNPSGSVASMFMPRSNGPQMFDGLNAPQTGGPRNTMISNRFGPEIRELQGQIPGSVPPFVAPPTSGLVDQLTAIQSQFANSALPLLEQLLGAQQQQYGIAESFMGPEMALREGLLSALGGQDNSLLEQLLLSQEQLSRGMQPRSGAYYFAGF